RERCPPLAELPGQSRCRTMADCHLAGKEQVRPNLAMLCSPAKNARRTAVAVEPPLYGGRRCDRCACSREPALASQDGQARTSSGSASAHVPVAPALIPPVVLAAVMCDAPTSDHGCQGESVGGDFGGPEDERWVWSSAVPPQVE